MTPEEWMWMCPFVLNLRLWSINVYNTVEGLLTETQTGAVVKCLWVRADVYGGFSGRQWRPLPASLENWSKLFKALLDFSGGSVECRGLTVTGSWMQECTVIISTLVANISRWQIHQVTLSFTLSGNVCVNKNTFWHGLTHINYLIFMHFFLY